ncbi:MAG TPA: cysteine--1-D-myo-inosityl 2-amino-2-deoxy-alpha-D-glucopyranoside ligase [Streptosporangiaceae bacterium]|nr:cysteine--1-D-myo-inosityl 2-amino-2-deoxy-alpha-D-glucopyranoside ligase [Streptosporangiaceae bacterium]
MDSWPAVSVPSLPGQAAEVVIWDTASNGLAVASQQQRATLYACGITPYDATHIGHAATYIAWDLLVRIWRDAGHEVCYAQNVTDVDDPLLERAARDGADWRELAGREIDRYRADMAALRVLPPDYLIGAVEALDVIEEFSAELAERGSLYDLDSDVYFCRSADPAFGSVSGLDYPEMVVLSAERGGDPGRPGKKDPLDPLVWTTERPGEPSWDSRFGRGRPGWHVECAAIATHYLGRAFDVQAGGSDLIFPHHEMSASHARVARAGAGEAFARRYLHAGMVRLGGVKMSKSLGNLVFVSELRESGVDPMAIRLAILAHHFRQDWDWTDEGLDAAVRRLDRWRTAVSLDASRSAGSAGSAGSAHASQSGDSAAVLAGIRERLADDLDAPGALGVVDRWADAVLASADAGAGAGAGAGASGLVRAAVDALLGVEL